MLTYALCPAAKWNGRDWKCDAGCMFCNGSSRVLTDCDCPMSQRDAGRHSVACPSQHPADVRSEGLAAAVPPAAAAGPKEIASC